MADDAGRWLRAVRQARSLSQRELAVLAKVPLSAVTAIESGRRSPRLELVDRILTAADHRLVLVDNGTGDVVTYGDVDDESRDRGGRRLPAHLARVSDPAASDHVVVNRPRNPRGPWREHPWFGQFRSRAGCFGPPAQPCANCLDNCRFGPATPG